MWEVQPGALEQVCCSICSSRRLSDPCRAELLTSGGFSNVPLPAELTVLDRATNYQAISSKGWQPSLLLHPRSLQDLSTPSKLICFKHLLRNKRSQSAHCFTQSWKWGYWSLPPQSCILFPPPKFFARKKLCWPQLQSALIHSLLLLWFCVIWAGLTVKSVSNVHMVCIRLPN